MPLPKRILIVDADTGVHQMLTGILSARGREVESAFDGKDALRRIEAVRYDLVLTDAQMPGLDGISLLERIQKESPETRVAVMTEAHTPETVVRAIQERAYTCFRKPLTEQCVVDLVDHALASTPEADDIEVLSARPDWLALRLRCKTETADRIQQFLLAMGSELRDAERQQVATAIREILLNAIEHGGHHDPDKHVAVTFVRATRALLYYVRDPGRGFSFDGLAHAAVANPEDSPMEHVLVREKMGMRPGGYGLMLTKQLVDEMIHNEAGNEVLLIKYLR